MGQHQSRAAFDSLLVKTHVQHALLQPDGRHNDTPTALATLFYLGATPDQLQDAYDSETAGLRPWNPAPGSITDEESKTRFLGDVRFQRSYMTFFSMENGRFGGNVKTLTLTHMFSGSRPLIYGLFSGLGQPLVFLSDGIELRSALLVVQSLVLSAVDWTEPIYELLTHPLLTTPTDELLSPEDILGRVAYDGRFSGVMRSGPGFHGVGQIFSSQNVKHAILEYVHRLDCRNEKLLVEQLSALSALLLCATHKPGVPAFDFYLAHLPTWVNSIRVILQAPNCDNESDRLTLIRGVWLLILLTYITQLRPVINSGLLLSVEMPQEDGDWESMFADFRRQCFSQEARTNRHLLRALRSLWELGKASGIGGKLHIQAAWKLVSEWERWIGMGDDREVTLNIRL
ncbi:hypothetical protein B0T24DRAFT_677529 [Lasiosphaeria ovina]|uniref:Uncharacterized protein n=1 Tax=Lasiosphaeria ovina TaxID=92902 RepID=A0AAE0NBL2_9PEZI|nr:hypothetical protein B0T24DRAFT_677529 [Lasiosphaeria ovina]